MSKLDIGVGEDFPVDEPPPQNEPEDGGRHGRHGRRGYGRHRHPHRHFGRYAYGFMAARIFAKVVMIALVIGALSFLFRAPFYAAAPVPYAAHPFWHFGFFFPGFFLLALLLLAFGHRHHHHRHGFGHDGMDWHDRCRDYREEA